jgi:hypothetical protein
MIRAATIPAVNRPVSVRQLSASDMRTRDRPLARYVALRTWIWLVTALAGASHPNVASAQLSLFRTEMRAHQHCPDDSIVWADLRKRIYYVKGQQLYAQGSTGTFVCRKEAGRSGYRRSLFGRR